MLNLSLRDLAISIRVSLMSLYLTPRVLVALEPRKTLIEELIFSLADSSPSGMFFLSGKAFRSAYNKSQWDRLDKVRREGGHTTT